MSSLTTLNSLFFTHHPQNLLGEVVVDERSLQGQTSRRVNASTAIILGWLRGGLTHSQQVKVGVISLVEEQLVAHSLNDNVPGVGRAGATHHGCQDGVRGKNIALGLGKLQCGHVYRISRLCTEFQDCVQKVKIVFRKVKIV